MCQYTYHHYRCCGHIAKWTVDSCAEFTNKLRQIAGDHERDSESSCINIEYDHDFLPENHPRYCLQCELDWQKHFPIRRPMDHANATASADSDRDVLHVEGLGTAEPILNLQAAMNLSNTTTNGQDVSPKDQSSSRFPTYDVCHVGMALVPRDTVDWSEDKVPLPVGKESPAIASGPHTTDLNPYGRKHYDWKPQVDQLDLAWDRAGVARIWGVICEDHDGPLMDNTTSPTTTSSITSGLSAADTASHEGTFYESSSSPDTTKSTGVLSPPASPVHDILADEVCLQYNGRNIYDWIPKYHDTNALTRRLLTKFEHDGFRGKDSIESEEDFDYDYDYDADSESEFDSEIEPFFVFSVFDVASDSPLSQASVFCNASETHPDYDDSDPDLEEPDYGYEELVEVISDPDSGSPTPSSPAVDGVASPMNYNPSDTDPDIECLESDNESVVEVTSDPGSIYRTPPSSPLACDNNNNNTANTARPRLTIRIPSPPFSGGRAYNMREARYLPSRDDSVGSDRDTPHINWGLGISIPEFHSDILQPHIN